MRKSRNHDRVLVAEKERVTQATGSRAVKLCPHMQTAVAKETRTTTEVRVLYGTASRVSCPAGADGLSLQNSDAEGREVEREGAHENARGRMSEGESH